MTPEKYLTVFNESGPFEFKEKGSRFISFIVHTETQEEAEEVLAEYRKKFFDSTHVCFAFRLGRGREEYFRSSDDGEPSGTAGLPILNELRGAELFNVIALVVRYYGGTKLGTGGLIRAYGAGARLAVEQSASEPVYIKFRGRINYSFDLTGEIMQIVSRFSAEIREQNYNDKGGELIVDIPVLKAEEFSRDLWEITRGKVKLCNADDHVSAKEG